MNRYIPVDQRKRDREWPCMAKSGAVVIVRCDRVTETDEDLSAWVESGLLVHAPEPTKSAAPKKAAPKKATKAKPVPKEVLEKIPEEEPEDIAPSKAVRARHEDGQFVADDLSTPDVNEAWEAPEEPSKEKAKPAVKSTAKKRLSRARKKKA